MSADPDERFNETSPPAAKPSCEHFYASHCYGGMSIRLCMLCHEPDWDDHRQQLEAAAQAAIAAAPACPCGGMPGTACGDLIAQLRADAVIAEDAIAELNTRILAAYAETRSFLARLDALAREFEASAAVTAPSKKSEIETAVAKRLRAITCTDPAIDSA